MIEKYVKKKEKRRRKKMGSSIIESKLTWWWLHDWERVVRKRALNLIMQHVLERIG